MGQWFTVGAGIGLLLVTVLAIWVGRPRNGRAHAGALASDTVAMFYILATLLCLVLGLSLLATAAF